MLTRLEAIKKELNYPENGDVVEHYNKLRKIELSKTKEFEGMKILIAQFVALGDVIISSLGAELLQLKFPGCTVDYLTEWQVIADAISANPWINKIHVSKDWEQWRKRDTFELSDFAKEYDLTYGLYWWNGNICKSFLEDMELSTDYTRVRLYPNPKVRDKVYDYYKNLKEPDFFDNKEWIAIPEESDLTSKWNTKDYNKLLDFLKSIGKVFIIKRDADFRETIELLRFCNLFVGVHGGLEHAAAAVDCQCVTIPLVINPEDCHVSSYQNKYTKFKHVAVKPTKWCESYNQCVTYDPNQFPHKLPPYGFPNKFRPHQYKECDWGYQPSTCVKEIPVDLVIEKVREAINEKC